jgi:hypothetical protein
MLGDITLRRSAVAFVYRDNPTIKREDNLQFYDRVTASGVNVTDFSIAGTELILLRRPVPGGAGGLEVRVGAFGPVPQLRFLVAQVVVGDPMQLIKENADLSWQAFNTVWGSRLSPPQVSEVMQEFSVPSPGGDSRKFLMERVGHIGAVPLRQLGREFQGFGFRMMSGPIFTIGEGPLPPLSSADAAVRVEVLMEDPSQLFIEITSKWPAISLSRDELPPPLREQVTTPIVQLNAEARPPTFYLDQVYNFVTTNVLGFLREAAS